MKYFLIDKTAPMIKPYGLTGDSWRFRRLLISHWIVGDRYAYELHKSWYFLANLASYSWLETLVSDYWVCFEHAHSQGVTTLITVSQFVGRTTQPLTNTFRLTDNKQEALSSADPVKSRFSLLKQCRKGILVLDGNKQTKTKTNPKKR